MFGNKLLVFIKKPSIYNIRKIRSVEDRKKTLETKLLTTNTLSISQNNREYFEAYDLIIK
jgi:hypothetical protein